MGGVKGFLRGIKPILRRDQNYFKGEGKKMSLQCIFNRFSVYVDVASNENVALFWTQSLSVCRGITFLIAQRLMFSLAQRPLVSVSIIEPEAPGVLLRFVKILPKAI